MRIVKPDIELKFISCPNQRIMDIIRSTSMELPEMMLYTENIPH